MDGDTDLDFCLRTPRCDGRDDLEGDFDLDLDFLSSTGISCAGRPKGEHDLDF